MSIEVGFKVVFRLCKVVVLVLVEMMSLNICF